MPKFTKKLSGLFNKMGDAKDKAIKSDAGPSIAAGSVIGSLAGGGALSAGMVALGVMAIPIGVGIPIVAAGVVVGAFTGKHLHDKKKGPKPGQ